MLLKASWKASCNRISSSVDLQLTAAMRQVIRKYLLVCMCMCVCVCASLLILYVGSYTLFGASIGRFVAHAHLLHARTSATKKQIQQKADPKAYRWTKGKYNSVDAHQWAPTLKPVTSEVSNIDYPVTVVTCEVNIQSQPSEQVWQRRI